jgi:hypothetical protein
MKLLRGAVWSCALVVLAAGVAPVQAAWDNVFQVTCWHRQPKTTASYYYAPAPVSVAQYSPCQTCTPCQQCTTSYVQRCYYQPVITYQTQSRYEPITTYQTSYYYEPVTTTHYSNYYDPCSCSYQQVAVPSTSLQLRSQTSAVQSWVQRNYVVPVTTQQQSFYWEAVTSCSSPVAAVPLVPTAVAPSTGPPPAAITEPRPAQGPGVSEFPNGRSSDAIPNQRYYPPGETTPGATGSSYRQPLPSNSAPDKQTAPPPAVKLDRITAIQGGQVRGQVVRGDNQPWAGVRILFVSVDQRLPRETVSTDSSGKFQANLASGGWLVYLQGSDERPTFHRKIEVSDSDKPELTLVSR